MALRITLSVVFAAAALFLFSSCGNDESLEYTIDTGREHAMELSRESDHFLELSWRRYKTAWSFCKWEFYLAENAVHDSVRTLHNEAGQVVDQAAESLKKEAEERASDAAEKLSGQD